MCKIFATSWHSRLLPRRAQSSYKSEQHHHLQLVFDSIGNVDAKISIILLILGVLDILLNPLPLPMPEHIIDTASKSKAVALLHAHWKPTAIASKIHCHRATVYGWEGNIQKHGHLNPPHPLRRGRPRAVHTAAKKGALEYVR